MHCIDSSLRFRKKTKEHLGCVIYIDEWGVSKVLPLIVHLLQSTGRLSQWEQVESFLMYRFMYVLSLLMLWGSWRPLGQFGLQWDCTSTYLSPVHAQWLHVQYVCFVSMRRNSPYRKRCPAIFVSFPHLIQEDVADSGLALHSGGIPYLLQLRPHFPFSGFWHKRLH